MANEYINNKTFEAVIKEFQTFKKKKAQYELIISDLQETHNRRIEKYGDDEKKEQLEAAQEEYKDICQYFLHYQNQLVCAFYILSENIASYTKFSGIDIDDAIQEGVLICFEKIDRFNPSKGKAFNYMTTCILNNYRQMYRSAKSYNEFKKKYQIFLNDKIDSVFIRNGKEQIFSKTGINCS